MDEKKFMSEVGEFMCLAEDFDEKDISDLYSTITGLSEGAATVKEIASPLKKLLGRLQPLADAVLRMYELLEED